MPGVSLQMETGWRIAGWRLVKWVLTKQETWRGACKASPRLCCRFQGDKNGCFKDELRGT